jgi:antitoxin MazE
MRVSKWGNSLAIRIPSSVVEALKLKEGDQIEVHVADKRKLEVARDRKIEEAIETMRKLRRPFPPDFKFDREEANER